VIGINDTIERRWGGKIKARGIYRDPVRSSHGHFVKTQRDTQAFLCTDLDLAPAAILGRFVSRWRIETTFQEARERLGVETQRQWSDLAILRTTSALLGLYSLVTVRASALTGTDPLLLTKTDPLSARVLVTRKSSSPGRRGVMNRSDGSAQRQASIPLFD